MLGLSATLPHSAQDHAMHWMIYGLAAQAVYAAGNHLDSHIVAHRVKGPASMPIYTAPEPSPRLLPWIPAV